MPDQLTAREILEQAFSYLLPAEPGERERWARDAWFEENYVAYFSRSGIKLDWREDPDDPDADWEFFNPKTGRQLDWHPGASIQRDTQCSMGAMMLAVGLTEDDYKAAEDDYENSWSDRIGAQLRSDPALVRATELLYEAIGAPRLDHQSYSWASSEPPADLKEVWGKLGAIIGWNDSEGRTFAEVQSAFEKAIKLAIEEV